MKQLLILLALFTMACSTEQDVPTPTNPADEYVLSSTTYCQCFSRHTKIYVNGELMQGGDAIVTQEWASNMRITVQDSVELIVDGTRSNAADIYNEIELNKLRSGTRLHYKGTYIRVMLYNE